MTSTQQTETPSSLIHPKVHCLRDSQKDNACHCKRHAHTAFHTSLWSTLRMCTVCMYVVPCRNRQRETLMTCRTEWDTLFLTGLPEVEQGQQPAPPHIARTAHCPGTHPPTTTHAPTMRHLQAVALPVCPVPSSMWSSESRKEVDTHVIDAQLAPRHLPIHCDAHAGWSTHAGRVLWAKQVPAVASTDHHHQLTRGKAKCSSHMHARTHAHSHRHMHTLRTHV